MDDLPDYGMPELETIRAHLGVDTPATEEGPVLVLSLDGRSIRQMLGQALDFGLVLVRAVEAAEYEMSIRGLIGRHIDADEAAITRFLEALRYQHAHHHLDRFRRDPDPRRRPVKDNAG